MDRNRNPDKTDWILIELVNIMLDAPLVIIIMYILNVVINNPSEKWFQVRHEMPIIVLLNINVENRENNYQRCR
jgi:hypothetical protein